MIRPYSGFIKIIEKNLKNLKEYTNIRYVKNSFINPDRANRSEQGLEFFVSRTYYALAPSQRLLWHFPECLVMDEVIVSTVRIYYDDEKDQFHCYGRTGNELSYKSPQFGTFEYVPWTDCPFGALKRLAGF